MFLVRKEVTFSASHNLSLNYDSPCQNIHGHNWVVVIAFRSSGLNENGMVIDFSDIKKRITEKFDHKNLNDIEPFNKGLNPTAENIAHVISNMFENCVECTVIESHGSIATYKPEKTMYFFVKNHKKSDSDFNGLINFAKAVKNFKGEE
jgi:6-pyruvoyltetrahydropterin/6-carboxytetrahydropterin synthase